MSDYADEDGSCYPGQARLAHMTGLSESTVRRSIRDLESEGLLSTSPRFEEGRQKTNRYWLAVGKLPVTVTGGSEYCRSDSSLLPVTQVDTAGHSDRQSIRDPSVEPSVLLSGNELPDKTGTLIPDEWRPNQKHIDLAGALHLDCVFEYQRFRAHAAENHRRQKNWNAAFTNWLRKSAEFAQKRGGRQVRRQSAVDRALDVVNLYRKEMAMNKRQVAKLLASAAVFDNREVTPAKVEAWFVVLGDLDFQEASRALAEHYRSSHEYLMPAHIVDGVRERHERRSLERPSLPPREAAVCRALGISPEEWLERQDEPGFVRDMTARAAAVLRGVTPLPGITTLGGGERSSSATGTQEETEKKGGSR